MIFLCFLWPSAGRTCLLPVWFHGTLCLSLYPDILVSLTQLWGPVVVPELSAGGGGEAGNWPLHVQECCEPAAKLWVPWCWPQWEYLHHDFWQLLPNQGYDILESWCTSTWGPWSQQYGFLLGSPKTSSAWYMVVLNTYLINEWRGSTWAL